MSEFETRKILVVEDNYLLATDITRTLQDHGVEVVGPCGAMQDALNAVRDDLPDCAIVDLDLGEGANFVLAEKLREHGIPFLFCTGHGQDVIPSRFSKVPRLEKPVSLLKLLHAAKTLCTKPYKSRPISEG